MNAILLGLLAAHPLFSQSKLAFNWINPGPRHLVGQQGSEVSGKLQAFAWVPSQPKVMYAGGGNGSGIEGPFTQAGVFKSINGGSTWTTIDVGLTDTAANVLWIDAAKPNVLLVGTEYGGLFRTTDGGQSWVNVAASAPVSAIVTIAGGVLAGTGRGFEISTDDGNTWTLLQPTSSPVRTIAAAGSSVIAGLEQGDVLWKGPSDQSWRTVASNPQYTVWDVAIDPVNPQTAFYIRAQGPTPNLVFRTIDGAASWQSIPVPTGIFSQTIAVRASDRTVFVAGQGMFYKSLDSGNTWSQLKAPWDSRKIFLYPGSSNLVIGSDHGLHMTDDDGSSWHDLSGSISANILYSVAVNGQTIFSSAQDFSPLVSFDGGATWNNPSGGGLAEGGAVAINPGNPTYCYAFTVAGFALSKDSCSTFAPVSGPIWQNYVSAANQNLITVDLRNPSTVYVGTSNGVWVSTDWGQTFQRLNWPIQNVTQIILDSSDSNAIYVCSTFGLYQSLNGGTNWARLSLPTNAYPYAVTVSPINSNVLLVALNEGAGRQQGGVLRSTDRGIRRAGGFKPNGSVAARWRGAFAFHGRFECDGWMG